MDSSSDQSSRFSLLSVVLIAVGTAVVFFAFGYFLDGRGALQPARNPEAKFVSLLSEAPKDFVLHEPVLGGTWFLEKVVFVGESTVLAAFSEGHVTEVNIYSRTNGSMEKSLSFFNGLLEVKEGKAVIRVGQEEARSFENVKAVYEYNEQGVMEKVQIPSSLPMKNIPVNKLDELELVSKWLSEQGLNQYGDPQDIFYTGGTPLFDERTGTRIDRLEYLKQKFPDEPWRE